MRIATRDIFLALILFVALMALPAYIKIADWLWWTMFSFSAVSVVVGWRLSYLSWRKKNDKAIS